MQPDPWERWSPLAGVAYVPVSIVLILRTARVTGWRKGPTAEG